MASERTSVTNLTTKAGPPQPVSGEGQWVLIGREFRKRRLAVVAAVVILSLVVISILAPLLANDRPIYYVGINRFEYREAARTLRSSIDRLIAARTTEPQLRDKNEKLTSATLPIIETANQQPKVSSSPVLQSLIGRIRDAVAKTNLSTTAGELTRGRDQLATGFPGSELTPLTDALNELIEVRKQRATATTTIADFPRIARLQVNLMAGALPAPEVIKIRELGQRIGQTLALTDIPRLTSELRSLQAEVRKFGSLDTAVVARPCWPVLASLRWYDIAFLAGTVLIFAWPVWIRILSVRNRSRWRTGFRLAALAPGLFPVICAGLWWMLIPERVDRTDYKAGILAAADGEQKAAVVYQTVMWPPIAYALDEYDLAGKLAPPAWYRKPGKEKGDDAGNVDGKSTSTVSEPKSTPLATGASPWNSPHWLGTDEQGRDVLCRMIWGGRVSLSVGMVAVVIYVSIGIVVGAMAGYFRGVCDLIISRIIEVVICFPSFFLILTIAAMVGPGLMNIMLVIGLTGWTGIARLVRGEFLRLVDQEFVLAGRALGYSPMRLIFRHVLPNAMAPVLVSATFGIAGAILTESSLSFLGMGISKPTPSWGSLLADGRETLDRASWLIHFPGLAIFLTITSYNLIGEALRDAADPRLRGSR
jgi:peptide/nickel transport system permease protein